MNSCSSMMTLIASPPYNNNKRERRKSQMQWVIAHSLIAVILPINTQQSCLNITPDPSAFNDLNGNHKISFNHNKHRPLFTAFMYGGRGKQTQATPPPTSSPTPIFSFDNLDEIAAGWGQQESRDGTTPTFPCDEGLKDASTSGSPPYRSDSSALPLPFLTDIVSNPISPDLIPPLGSSAPLELANATSPSTSSSVPPLKLRNCFPYKFFCQFCHQGFSRKHDLKRHLNRHPISPPASGVSTSQINQKTRKLLPRPCSATAIANSSHIFTNTAITPDTSDKTSIKEILKAHLMRHRKSSSVVPTTCANTSSVTAAPSALGIAPPSSISPPSSTVTYPEFCIRL